ncbi:hypothetical protein ACA910_011461 [Epithemia clementina (nom. ined.)]
MASFWFPTSDDEDTGECDLDGGSVAKPTSRKKRKLVLDDDDDDWEPPPSRAKAPPATSVSINRNQETKNSYPPLWNPFLVDSDDDDDEKGVYASSPLQNQKQCQAATTCAKDVAAATTPATGRQQRRTPGHLKCHDDDDDDDWSPFPTATRPAAGSQKNPFLDSDDDADDTYGDKTKHLEFWEYESDDDHRLQLSSVVGAAMASRIKFISGDDKIHKTMKNNNNIIITGKKWKLNFFVSERQHEAHERMRELVKRRRRLRRHEHYLIIFDQTPIQFYEWHLQQQRQRQQYSSHTQSQLLQHKGRRYEDDEEDNNWKLPAKPSFLVIATTAAADSQEPNQKEKQQMATDKLGSLVAQAAHPKSYAAAATRTKTIPIACSLSLPLGSQIEGAATITSDNIPASESGRQKDCNLWSACCGLGDPGSCCSYFTYTLDERKLLLSPLVLLLAQRQQEKHHNGEDYLRVSKTAESPGELPPRQGQPPQQQTHMWRQEPAIGPDISQRGRCHFNTHADLFEVIAGMKIGRIRDVRSIDQHQPPLQKILFLRRLIHFLCTSMRNLQQTPTYYSDGNHKKELSFAASTIRTNFYTECGHWLKPYSQQQRKTSGALDCDNVVRNEHDLE